MNLIRKTSMTYGLFTDASTRFTKGQSPRQNMAVLSYAVSEIKKYAGGKVGSKTIDLKSQKHPAKIINISDATFIGERLGLPGLTIPAIKHLLSNVEFEVNSSGAKGLDIEVPFWRTDIEIPEDIVEEVGRLYGYGNLPLVLPSKAIVPAAANSSLELKHLIRNILSSAGANEVLTYSFVHESLLEAAGQNIRHAYHLKNAISPDLQYYRTSLAPSLLDKVHANVKQGTKDFAIYEIGSVHNRNFIDKEKLPKELQSLGFVITKAKLNDAAYYSAKYYLEYLLSKLNINNLEYLQLEQAKKQTHAATSYEPTRSAFVRVGGIGLAIVGEPSRDLKTKLKLPESTAMFELDLEALSGLVSQASYEPLGRFPGSDQDFCLRSDESISYSALTNFMRTNLDKACQEHGYDCVISPLDIYQKETGGAKKQTTWRITLSHPERTLTTIEVNKLLDALASDAKTKLKAERI